LSGNEKSGNLNCHSKKRDVLHSKCFLCRHLPLDCYLITFRFSHRMRRAQKEAQDAQKEATFG